jgi:predicted protein tyrosine phosphatase
MAKLLPCPLTICGVAELDGFAKVGVSHVLSILDPADPEPPVFERFRQHRRTSLRFHDVVVPVDGHQLPVEADVERILEFGRDLSTSDPLHLLVHCYAGVSRSTAASLILMAQANPGREADLFAELIEVRPRAWPNSRMVGFADDMLGCNGRLKAALQDHYRTAVKRVPGLADMIRGIKHRAHEVPEIEA